MNQQLAIDFTAAMQARDLGMQRAGDHANRVDSEWTGQAIGLLIAFVDEHQDPFLIEAFRAWAQAKGLALPPDGRAYGTVTKRAQAKGIITKVGSGAAASSNCSLKVKWQGSRWLR